MRVDPTSFARAQATFAAVRVRASGRCEECGARDAQPVCLLEGLPLEDNTLNLCGGCSPVLSRRLGELATTKELAAAVAERIARAAKRR